MALPHPSRVVWSVAALCLVQFIDVLGVTSATTAIPRMIEELSAPSWSTGVLATVYAMFFGGFLVLGSRLGDQYGHRRVLLSGVVLFTAVAVLGLTAPHVIQLVVTRAIQGFAAAISVPSALRLLLHVTPEGPLRRTSVAAWGASGAAAGALGFFVGGVLTDGWSWRAIYWINVPIGTLLAIAICALVPPLPATRGTQRIDAAGAFLLVTAIMAVVVGASMAELPPLRWVGAGAVALGLLVGVLFVVQQRHADDPLIPRGAYASTNLRTGTAVSFVNTATTSSTGFLVTLYLQQDRGASPLAAGLSLMPFSLAVIGGSFLARPLGDRWADRRLAAGGLAAVAIGTFVLALTRGSQAGVLAGVLVAGLGLGLASVGATSIGTTVPAALTGSAAGILNTGAQLGTAVGVAALVSFAATTFTPPNGVYAAWVLAGLLAAVSATILLRPQRDKVSHAQ